MRRLWRALGYSFQGLRHAFRDEQAFRLEVYLALVMIPAALWLSRTPVECALLVGSVLLVMLAELLNTAIEAVVDRISADIHPQAGKAKDCASAAVLMAAVIAAVTWGMILAPRLMP